MTLARHFSLKESGEIALLFFACWLWWYDHYHTCINKRHSLEFFRASFNDWTFWPSYFSARFFLQTNDGGHYKCSMKNWPAVLAFIGVKGVTLGRPKRRKGVYGWKLSSALILCRNDVYVFRYTVGFISIIKSIVPYFFLRLLPFFNLQ